MRRRIAVAARNFTRGLGNWRKDDLDEHYYPVQRPDGGVHRARFCTSTRHQHLRHSSIRSYEGTLPCTAHTPLGKMLACPEIYHRQTCPYDPNDPDSAHIVYVGHNSLGNEVQWLPVQYLQNWWREAGHKLVVDYDDGPMLLHDDFVPELLQRLDGQHNWCDDWKRPIRFSGPRASWNAYRRCAETKLEGAADDFAGRLLLGSSTSRQTTDPLIRGQAFGRVYSSLPATRVPMLRDPMSWLASRFAWHSVGRNFNLTCDDVEQATSGDEENYSDATGTGWVNHYAMIYIMNLCGEDCLVRYYTHGNVTLQELEAQASWNLRHSLAVVGLLHETESFYDMITARVQYMDMSDNSTEGTGLHKSGKTNYCKDRFEDAEFQAALVAASPALATLTRLYEVGLQVNAFQKRELEQCTGRKIGSEGSIK